MSQGRTYLNNIGANENSLGSLVTQLAAAGADVDYCITPRMFKWRITFRLSRWAASLGTQRLLLRALANTEGMTPLMQAA